MVTELAGGRVVVVNNDPQHADFITVNLERQNLEVRTFIAADTALEAIRQSDAPDLVVVDLHTHGIDGWRFCSLLRSPEFRQMNDTPLLVTSALYSGEDVQGITYDLGANAFLGIPCTPHELERTVKGLLTGESPRTKPLAMIVDDDSGMRHLLERGLSAHGYCTQTASTVSEAKIMFAESDPRVVFVDHHLVDGVGMDLLAQLRVPGRDVVVIVMTGDLSADVAVEYMLCGADGFATKPFKVKYLVGLVRRAQRQRSLLRVEELLATRA